MKISGATAKVTSTPKKMSQSKNSNTVKKNTTSKATASKTTTSKNTPSKTTQKTATTNKESKASQKTTTNGTNKINQKTIVETVSKVGQTVALGIGIASTGKSVSKPAATNTASSAGQKTVTTNVTNKTATSTGNKTSTQVTASDKAGQTTQPVKKTANTANENVQKPKVEDIKMSGLKLPTVGMVIPDEGMRTNGSPVMTETVHTSYGDLPAKPKDAVSMLKGVDLFDAELKAGAAEQKKKKEGKKTENAGSDQKGKKGSSAGQKGTITGKQDKSKEVTVDYKVKAPVIRHNDGRGIPYRDGEKPRPRRTLHDSRGSYHLDNPRKATKYDEHTELTFFYPVPIAGELAAAWNAKLYYDEGKYPEAALNALVVIAKGEGVVRWMKGTAEGVSGAAEAVEAVDDVADDVVNTSRAAAAAEAAGKGIESGSNSNGRYTGGRTKQELKALREDPAHSGSTRPIDIEKGQHEARVGLELEERGDLKNITRDATGRAEFIDGNGQAWDVKSFNSNYKPNKGGFRLDKAMNTIKKSLSENENVIVDTSNMSPEHIIELTTEIKNQGLENNILFWP